MRNLKAVSLGLSAGLSVVVGRNGQGKTSLLEAVYLLGTGRSFRTRRQDELIAWGGGPLRVAGKVAGRLGRTQLTVVMDSESRSLLADGAEQELEAFIGRLDVVDLTAERMKVVRGGPDERRRFIDRGIVGLDASFLRVLGEYRRTLLQRNALLRGRPDPQVLDVWDERLVRAAAAVHRRRREYTLLLGSQLGEAGRVPFAGGSEIRIRYRPSPAEAGEADPAEFERILAESLGRGRSRDLALGHTFGGPHRDDLAVELDGIELRRYGSAGQVRASMIALKLGKLSLVRQDRGEAPIFLMDDFDSDLDEVRASALAAYLNEAGFQALVATSKETMAERFEVGSKRIKIEDGVARAA